MRNEPGEAGRERIRQEIAERQARADARMVAQQPKGWAKVRQYLGW